MFCRQQVAELAENEHVFRELGVRLVVIGNGDTQHFKKLKEKTGYTGELYTDPERIAYKLLDFDSGITKVMGFKPLTDATKLLFSGILPGSLQGSATQLGGAVAINTKGVILYHYKEKIAGDHPPLTQLIDALH